MNKQNKASNNKRTVTLMDINSHTRHKTLTLLKILVIFTLLSTCNKKTHPFHIYINEIDIRSYNLRDSVRWYSRTQEQL